MPQRKTKKPLSVRTSIIVWVGGAVLGWALAVVTLYNALRFADGNVAEGPPAAETGQAPALATQDATDLLSPDELRALSETAPAAGPEHTGGAGNARETDETGTSAPEKTPEPQAESKPE